MTYGMTNFNHSDGGAVSEMIVNQGLNRPGARVETPTPTPQTSNRGLKVPFLSQKY